MGEKTFKTVKLRGGYFLKTILSVRTGVSPIFKLHLRHIVLKLLLQRDIAFLQLSVFIFQLLWTHAHAHCF